MARAKSRTQRLDLRCVDEAIARDIDHAKAIIMAGEVYVDGVKHDKSGASISVDSLIERRTKRGRFVSRAGEKLEAALLSWQFVATGKFCLDLGASTGGFTDCLLKRGASGVLSIDAGKHQLHYRLRNDPRVICAEEYNARHISSADISQMISARFMKPITLMVADLSFISTTAVLPAAISAVVEYNDRLQADRTRPDTRSPHWGDIDLIVLVKPQFEATRAEIETGGKGGVIIDKELRETIVLRTIEALTLRNIQLMDRRPSSVRGPKGNLEEVVWLKRHAI